MKVLMVGVSKENKGGMWTVVENYLNNEEFIKSVNLKYIPTITRANKIKKVFFSLNAIKKVKKELEKEHFDILHIHMSERGSVLRTRILEKIAHKNSTKVIIHMHGAEFQSWYEKLGTNQQEKVRETLNNADKILILGYYWKEFIGTLVKEKNKIEVLYNSVVEQKNNKFNNESRNILFLGLVGKRKGIFDVVEAIKRIKENNIKFKLQVYGPDETEGFEEIIKNNNLQDYIEYNGWLSNEGKEKVFTNIKLNILPSYNEGLPMTILETMSYGIPNLSTNVAAIPEVVNNDNGYIIEPGDIDGIVSSILDSLENKNDKRSANSFNTIKKNYTIDVHIKKLQSIYNSMTGRK